MTIDIISLGMEKLEAARELMESRPEKAAALEVDEKTLEMAEDFLLDPLFSPHHDAAKKLIALVSEGKPKHVRQETERFLSRVKKGGFTREGETSWQKAAKEYSSASEWDDDIPVAQGIAADYMAFMKRAMQDLNAYVAAPYSPLHERARLLTHRIWSSDRRWDRDLVNDLSAWLNDFEKLARENANFVEHLQKSTRSAMRDLFDATNLILLRAEKPGGFDPLFVNDPWIVDGAWIMLSGRGRFAEFAAPFAGAVVLIDTGVVKGGAPFVSRFEDAFPGGVRFSYHDRIAGWIHEEQDLLETVRIAGEAGVVPYQGEADVVIRGASLLAPVLSFSDFAGWFNATDTLSDFNLQLYPKPQGWEEMTKSVAGSFLKLAEAGLISVSPQFYANKESGEVRIANLASIFRMKGFPYNFFISSITNSITSRFDLVSERPAVEQLVKKEVLEFLRENRLPAGIDVVNIPGEEKSTGPAPALSTDTVDASKAPRVEVERDEDTPVLGKNGKGGPSAKKRPHLPMKAGGQFMNLPVAVPKK